MKLEEKSILFIKEKYGTAFSGLVFAFEIGKFNELSFRFDSKDKPDKSNLGHDYSFNSIATRFQARNPVLMDSANFGEYYGGPLGYYWLMKCGLPIDFISQLTVPKFKNGHSIHMVSVLKENYHWNTIEATIVASIFENGNFIKTISIAQNMELINDSSMVNSFKVNW